MGYLRLHCNAYAGQAGCSRQFRSPGPFCIVVSFVVLLFEKIIEIYLD